MAALYIAVASYAPLLWDAWLGHVQLLNLEKWHIAAQIVAGYAGLQFVAYWWHRALHGSDFLWRHLHQMHHSVERMDGWGALYHHPLDTIGFTFAASLALTVIGGLTPAAVMAVSFIGLGAVLLTHANIRTPQWLGVVFQRPEGHGIHHQRGHHRQNYAELAIWDMVFGTWANPRDWNEQAGFEDGASARFVPLLIGRDISTPQDRAEAATPAVNDARTA
jgi:sterol desaturase/sphingolipid hydroxylase (fatty acid hydroxylase superfamily)